MSLHDVTYQHWEGQHKGIWHRRWVIAANGLRSCLDNKWARNLILLSWILGLIQIAILFIVGQLLVEDSVVFTLVAQFDPQVRLIVNGLVSWLIDHPEISVRTTYNIFFYFFATNLRFLAMASIVLVIPHLITRDLSSRAIIIYSSKAVSRSDYFLGKFGTVFALLSLVWLGPLVTAWFAGNFLSSNWQFFWHSKTALFNTLAYTLTAMTVLSILALGISSLSTKPRAATSYWIILWFVGNAVRGIGEHTKPWLQHVSISYDFDQIALSIFNLAEELQVAQEAIPLLGVMFREMRNNPFGWFEAKDLTGTVTALAILVVASIVIMKQRVKPE